MKIQYKESLYFILLQVILFNTKELHSRSNDDEKLPNCQMNISKSFPLI